MINLKPHIPVGTRHKMLFISNEIEGVSFVDLGQELSKAIEPLLDKKRLPLLADDALERIITNNSVVDAALGDYVAIKNIGILFEPALNLDIQSKFDLWSRSRILLVHLEGVIQDKIFYLSRNSNKKYSVNLKDITYNTLYDEI
jgi:hypothetical protein